MNLLTVMLALGASVFAASCAEAPPPEEQPSQIPAEDLRRLERSVTRAAEELARSGVPEWRLSALIRIDGSRYLLDDVAGVRMAPHGEVVVSQPKRGALLVFSPAGDLLRSIGRKGDGPGEFTFMGAFGFVGDTLWVEDGAARRLTLLGIDGTLRKVIPYVGMSLASLHDLLPAEMRSTSDAFRLMGPQAMWSDGSAVSLVGVWSEVGFPSAHNRTPLVSLARDLRPLRLIALLPNTTISYVSGTGSDKREIGIDSPYGNEFVAFVTSPSGNRMAIVTADYKASVIRIVQLSLRGDTLSKHSIPLRGVAIPLSEVDQYATDAAEQLGRPRDVGAIRAAISQRPLITPPYRHAFLADNGALWLAGQGDLTRVLWTCVSPEGRVEGYTFMPFRSSPEVLDGTSLWTVTTDSNDVESVEKLQIVKGKSGG